MSLFSITLITATTAIAAMLKSTMGAKTPAPSSCVIILLLKYPSPLCAPSHSAIAAPIIERGTAIFKAEKKLGSAPGILSLKNISFARAVCYKQFFHFPFGRFKAVKNGYGYGEKCYKHGYKHFAPNAVAEPQHKKRGGRLPS